MLKELLDALKRGWTSTKAPPPQPRPFLAQAKAIAVRYPYPAEPFEEALRCGLSEDEIDRLTTYGISMGMGVQCLLQKAHERRDARDRLLHAVRRSGIDVVMWARLSPSEDIEWNGPGWTLGTRMAKQGVGFVVLDRHLDKVTVELNALEPGQAEAASDIIACWGACT